MSDIKVGREHLAGLELALDALGAYCAGSKADAECVLHPMIAQASAAPEQEPVAERDALLRAFPTGCDLAMSEDGYASPNECGKCAACQTKALLSASAEPAGPWIKCSDRLPEYNQNVLVCFETVLGTQQTTTAQLNHLKRCADPLSTDYDDIWYVAVGFAHKIKPTHWMPLPDAPAQGGDGE